MNHTHEQIRKSVNWGGKSIRLVMIAALIGLVLSIMPTTTAATPLRAQPRLLEMARTQPDATVSVIVQKMVQNQTVEESVTRLGGVVTADLHIINGFAAELKARDVPALAQSAGVRWLSWDAPVIKTDCNACVNTANLKNTFIYAIRANKVWNAPPYLQGQGIGVAVVDSGVRWQNDLYTIMGVNRVVANVFFNDGWNHTFWDSYGHGSHVAGVIGGNGRNSNGQYIGVAPMVNLINVKVSDDLNHGQSTTKNVVQGLQWILNHKDQYNIKVANLSFNSAEDESYHTNPIDAAVEILWFNKIVVVVSAGNQGTGALYPPANDPFVITVGATDDKGTASIADDTVTSFSAYGTTSDGFAKPDLVAPGVNIIGLTGNSGVGMQADHPDHIVGSEYFRMSGTSTSAPMVAAAAALILQDEHDLTPDQVKFRLMATANQSWAGYDAAKAGAGYLDVFAAVSGNTTESANTGTTASQLLWTGPTPVTWESAQWGSAQWGSVQWGSVQWASVQWGTAQWGSDYWGP